MHSNLNEKSLEKANLSSYKLAAVMFSLSLLLFPW